MFRQEAARSSKRYAANKSLRQTSLHDFKDEENSAGNSESSIFETLKPNVDDFSMADSPESSIYQPHAELLNVSEESTTPISRRFNGASCALDKGLMKELISTKGCTIVQRGRGELTILKVDYKSPAFKAYSDFYLPGGREPDQLDESDPVYVVVPILAGENVAPDNLQMPLLREVMSTLLAYAPLRRSAFNGAAVPPVPLILTDQPRMGVRFHHGTISSRMVMERIEIGQGLPITALPARTLLVQLNIAYANCALSLDLVKQQILNQPSSVD